MLYQEVITLAAKLLVISLFLTKLLLHFNLLLTDLTYLILLKQEILSRTSKLSQIMCTVINEVLMICMLKGQIGSIYMYSIQVSMCDQVLCITYLASYYHMVCGEMSYIYHSL